MAQLLPEFRRVTYLKPHIMIRRLRFFPLLVIIAFTSCESDFNKYSAISGDYMEGEIQTGENYKDYAENQFIAVAEQPISTFSVDADGGAYANMRRYMYLGEKPPTAAVRIEEFINYFTFEYAEPAAGENVALNSELSSCPWDDSHALMRLGMKGKTLSDAEMGNSNYVFLIDVSGSMDSPDKLGILKTGFKTMVDHLEKGDRVAIVTYAGSAEVLLKSTNGDETRKIKNAIESLGAGGSTAGAEGIITAYEIAEEIFIEGGNNRIIIGSDGDFNVGPSSTEDLVALIEKKRESGIYLTVLGVGGGNLNDHMMEQIANNGNGNYEYIDNAKQLEKVFINEKAKFYTVAKDSKIQITFNPNMVSSYRLIGYENRSLNDEDFENDTTDAGEIGSTQTITAMYELILSDAAVAEKYAQFDFRYKKPGETESRLMNHEILTAPVDISLASENMHFAVSIIGFGLLMKESEFAGSLDKEMVLEWGELATGFDPNGYREEFLELVGDWNE
jgi:Ca-activated chloride channel homolog